jgi:hypothetical protein
MNRQELHDFLVDTLGLVPEAHENAVSRTYFHRRIEWHPCRSTRVFRVLFEQNGEPGRIQLCASSDNNNSVLVHAPYHPQLLSKLAAQEIALMGARAQGSDN